MSRRRYRSVIEGYKPEVRVPESNFYLQQEQPKTLTVYKTRKNYPNTRDPHLWGPALWLFLHISSVNYTPESQEQVDRCIAFIKNLPYMLPCYNCSQHAKQYIADNEADLPKICSSRKGLFEFYVDFHNYVNNRQNKRLFSYDESWNMYANGAGVLNFSF